MYVRYFRSHWLLDSELNRTKLPKEAQSFWSAHIPKTAIADGVVVAYEKGVVVGFFRWENTKPKGKGLWALGTWVSKSQRGRGLGLKMWLRAIKYWKPPFIHVTVVSDSGLALVKKVEAKHPKIRWEIG